MTAILDTNHMIETPHQELLPAITEAPSPIEAAQAEQTAGNWPEALQQLPRSTDRVVLGIGMLAMGVRGPNITREMVWAFHDNLVRNFSTTGSAIAAVAAGSLYTARSVKQRFSRSRPE